MDNLNPNNYLIRAYCKKCAEWAPLGNNWSKERKVRCSYCSTPFWGRIGGMDFMPRTPEELKESANVEYFYFNKVINGYNRMV